MARQSGDAQAGVMACLLCGHTQLKVGGSEVREERPPAAFVIVSCAYCDHCPETFNNTNMAKTSFYVCAEVSRPCQSRRGAPCARRLTPLPNPSTLAPSDPDCAPSCGTTMEPIDATRSYDPILQVSHHDWPT